MKKWILIGLIALSARASADIAASVDYLYLKPYIDDMDFVLRSTNGIINLDENTIDGDCRYLGVRLDFSSGVRGKILVSDLLCGINISGSYTYFQTSASRSKNSGDPNILFATLNHGGLDISNITSAKGDWNLNYQTADALLSYDFCLDGRHILTPLVGAVCLFFNQDVKAHYHSNFTGNFSTFDGDQKYTAYGLKAGLEYVFFVADNFDLYANAYGSLVAGLAKTTDETKRIVNIEDGQDIADVALKCKEDLLVPGWHLGLGVSYHECFCGSEIGIRIGYEILAWHGVLGPARFMKGGIGLGTGSSRSTSTFGLQGLTAGLQVRF